MIEERWMTPHERMSHDIAMGWEWMQEMQRRRKEQRREWNARRRALWFWDQTLPPTLWPAAYGPQPAPYDPGGIGVMG